MDLLLSDRSLESSVGSPWGTRQPEPYFDKSFKIYHIPLKADLRSPFQPDDEIHVAEQEAKKGEKDESDAEAKEESGAADEEGTEEAKEKEAGKKDEEEIPDVEIDLDGIQARLIEVPAPPGN